MWFERDKEFILKNYLLKKTLNGVIPRNKQMIEAAAKSVSKNEKIWWYELQGFYSCFNSSCSNMFLT